MLSLFSNLMQSTLESAVAMFTLLETGVFCLVEVRYEVHVWKLVLCCDWDLQIWTAVLREGSSTPQESMTHGYQSQYQHNHQPCCFAPSPLPSGGLGFRHSCVDQINQWMHVTVNLMIKCEACRGQCKLYYMWCTKSGISCLILALSARGL